MKMNFNCYAHILVHHPYIIISAIAVFSGTCLIIPFTLKTRVFPDFSDPQAGFTTRGTVISNRLTAWENLVKSTKPSGQFAINPQEFQMKRNITFSRPKNKKKDNKRRNKFKNNNLPTKVVVNDKNSIYNYSNNVTDNSYEKWRVLSNLLNSKTFDNLNRKEPSEPDGLLCGYPDERYAHVVLKSKYNENLFTLKSLFALCRIERMFNDGYYYKDLCIMNSKSTKCCKPWSLVNYITVLHNKVSCLSITEEDVSSTISLLKNCSQHFHNLHLMPDCTERGYCDAPLECIKHDAVFNILNFLTSTTFMPPNETNTDPYLTETIIFLPIACSTATLPYYHYLEKINIEYEGISVVAMEFGIKSALFDECLLNDVWLIVLGALFVILCIWLYTNSLFLTIMTIIAIIFSLGISYFMYTVIFELNFFPFINLLAVIVAIGIGADDAFVFCKVLYNFKKEQTSLLKLISHTFRHAFFAMFVTSLTTAVAFLSSYISSVTAICCFSVFAGTAVITNFCLMITWFPACVVLWERSFFSNVNVAKTFLMACIQHWCCPKLIKPQLNLSNTCYMNSLFGRLWLNKQQYLLDSIIKFRYFWLILLSMLAVFSSVIVVYYPKLELPTSKEFQLFHNKHLFEQYDFVYKNHFWFKRNERINTDAGNFKLPLRFVWGVLPVDNGNYLDPTNLGKLKLDNSFDISKPESLKWLLEFCHNIKYENFYQSIFGPLLPNCFIETFKKSMERNCIDPFSYRDHTPCCKTSKFPYNSTVFNKCIIDEMTEIYETPSQYLIPGMAGPKFSKDQFPTIKAVIVEYDSNYTYSMSYEYMNDFYTNVENWMKQQLNTAPETMKNGWFISDLHFYDLQRELSRSTIIAIIASMGLALLVLILSTLNLLISLYAIVTITCSIFVTVAILVLLGWKLNILESITITLAIGLTVDFSLHYAVNYGLCPIAISKDRIAATKYSLSNMVGPVLMAALTTGIVGGFMLLSSVLPYIQIGVFLVTVMSVSWLYATFFLGSLLATIGPQNHFGQFSYKQLLCWCNKNKLNTRADDNTIDNRTINSERNRSITTSSLDTHELESLTCKIKPIRKGLKKSFSCTGNSIGKNNSNKYVFTDQSPSATSAITIIMADDN